MAQLSTTTLFNDANLVAYYKLEDVNDSKGARTLSNQGTTPFSGAKYSNGANFGTGNTNKDLELLGDNYGIGTGNITISCWIKCIDEIGAGSWTLTSLNKVSPNPVKHSIIYEYNAGTRRIGFARIRTQVAGDVSYTNSTLGTSVWHHLVYTYDGTNVSGYIDNVASGNTASSGYGVDPSRSDFSIGCYIDDPTITARGGFSSVIVDDLAIFNRVLTSTEVSILFTDPPTSIKNITGYFDV